MKKICVAAIALLACLTAAQAQEQNQNWQKVYLRVTNFPKGEQMEIQDSVLNSLNHRTFGKGIHDYSRNLKEDQLIFTIDDRFTAASLQELLEQKTIQTRVDSVVSIAPYEVHAKKVGEALGTAAKETKDAAHDAGHAIKDGFGKFKDAFNKKAGN